MTGNKQLEWRSKHVICSYDVDPRLTARLPVLCGFMQEAAYHHAEHLDLGHSHLSAKNMGWVLARQRIEIHRLPKWGEAVKVRTWPSGRDRLFFYRDFEISDRAGNLILQAATAWFMIDIEKRERVHSGFYLGSDLPAAGSKVFSSKLGRLKSCGCGDGESMAVNYGDLDMNGHVNNVRYIEWVLNSLPLEFHQAHGLQSLEVNYLAEAVYGHSVSICTDEADPLHFNHGIWAGEAELFRARSVWKQS
ncbi:MAG: thioesterase [Verrucomicrobiota bacterium]|nr:thioesterase [Verrucomicrobiota bacterium]